MESKTLVITVLAGVVLTWGALYLVYQASPKCQTEEILRSDSPDGAFRAVYENAVCDSAPETVEARIYADSLRDRSIQRKLVYRATSVVDRTLDRKTKGGNLRFEWAAGSNLLVYPDLGLRQDFSVAQGAPINVKVNAGGGFGGVSPGDAANRATQILESGNQDLIERQLVAELYSKFGSPDVWPLVDALWKLETEKFPKVDWTLVGSPRMRISIAGLWGQWAREYKQVDGLAAAAAYVRPFITSADAFTRGSAITALGQVGEVSDREVLLRIAKGEDLQDAKRAASGILAIERNYKVTPSLLSQLDRNEFSEELRLHVKGLLSVRNVAPSPATR